MVATQRPGPRPGKVVGNDRLTLANPQRLLTPAESTFCDAILLGWQYWRAYATATGSTAKKASTETMAWKWLQRPAVQRELATRRAALDERMAATRTEKRVVLANILRDPGMPALARIGAIQVDNRMTGDDEPKKALNSGGALQFSVDPMRDMRRAESISVSTTAGPALPPADAKKPTG